MTGAKPIKVQTSSGWSTIIALICCTIMCCAIAYQVDNLFSADDLYGRILPVRLRPISSMEFSFFDGVKLHLDWTTATQSPRWDALLPSVDTGDGKLGFEFRVLRFAQPSSPFGASVRYGRVAYIELQVPFWFLSFVFSIYPLFWIWRAAKFRKMRRLVLDEKCRACGYDLRASKDRCPECGTPIPTRAKKS
jgi:hypothetical protein